MNFDVISTVNGISCEPLQVRQIDVIIYSVTTHFHKLNSRRVFTAQTLYSGVILSGEAFLKVPNFQRSAARAKQGYLF